jgi:hypothetical protein
MALIDDFKAEFPEFDATQVDTYFSQLEAIYPTFYGGTYVDGDTVSADNNAILWLLAHLFVVRTVMNQTMGGVTEIDSSDYDAYFKLSIYGQTYLTLIRNNHGGRPV